MTDEVAAQVRAEDLRAHVEGVVDLVCRAGGAEVDRLAEVPHLEELVAVHAPDQKAVPRCDIGVAVKTAAL